MEKVKKFFKTVPMKLYILLAAILGAAFFSNDFDLVDVQKTAVITAAGVDKQDEEFVLSAQIAVPQGNSESGGGVSSTVTVSANGQTVSDCISKIYAQTGWVPKLVFCDLVILGEEAAKEDALACLDFFLRNEHMPDSALVAVCEGSAKELLTSTSAMDDSPGQAIQKLFTEAAQSSGKVATNTLREFAIEYYGVSKSGHMPYITTSEQESTSAKTPSGNSGGGSEEDPAVTYNAEQTALFQDGKMKGKLTREETFAYSLVQGKVFAGTFTAKEDEKPVALSILKNDGSVNLDTKSNPKAKVSLSVTLRLYNRGVPSPVNEIAVHTMSDELLKNAEEVLRGYIESLLNTCKEAECDLFSLKTQLYRSSRKQFAEWKELVPNAIPTEITTNVNKVQ